MNHQYPIHIIDDEEEVLEAVSLLLESVGYSVFTHNDAAAFLAQNQADALAVILLDVRMPGIGGLRLQKQLHEARAVQPIIFMSGHADIAMAVDAVKKGALDFLEKPFRDAELFDAVERAFAQLRHTQSTLPARMACEASVSSLTEREHEVMMAIADGHSNKIIARMFDISPRTIEIHRARIFQKLDVENAQQLVRKLMRFSFIKH